MKQQKLQQVILNLFALFIFGVFANAQSKVVPIIDLKVGVLLGGVKDGKYLDAKTTVKTMSGKTDYTLFHLTGKVERILQVGKPKQECPDSFYSLDLSDREGNFHEKGGTALGKGYDWNPLPRAPKPIALDNAEYKRIVADYLLTKGIAKHELKLKQAIRVDLEGDGKEEVLLVARRYFPYNQKDGKKAFDEYSVVLMRKIVNGKAQTILVAGEIYPKNKYDYDGYFFELSSILDLSGDGKMELVVYGEYHEGSETQVFEIAGNKAVKVKALNASSSGPC